MRKRFLALSLAIVVLAAVGCSSYQTKPAATSTPAPSKPGEISVTASYPRFQPSTLSLKKGQAIQLKVTATDANHTFTVDELGINISVAKGQTVSREIKIDQVGTFTFYCAIPGHRGAGMVGTILVTE